MRLGAHCQKRYGSIGIRAFRMHPSILSYVFKTLRNMPNSQILSSTKSMTPTCEVIWTIRLLIESNMRLLIQKFNFIQLQSLIWFALH